MAKGSGVLDQLRREIRRAEKRGISRYRIAKLSGVGQATLCRFMSGTLLKMQVETAEKLAGALELRIVLEKAG